jgi:hypothetical protein
VVGFCLLGLTAGPVEAMAIFTGETTLRSPAFLSIA